MEDAAAARARKIRRRILVVLLVLLLLPVLVVTGAVIFVSSSAGQALVLDKALAAAGAALAGKVDAAEVKLVGNHLVLTGLKLFTPEGELVASLARLEADVELAALVRKRIHLDNVELKTPQVFLKQDARGWNLMRAVASKTPPRPDEKSSPLEWTVELGNLELTSGLFDLEQEGLRLTATKLSARGDAQVALDPLKVVGTLDLNAVLTSPLEETLLAKVSAATVKGPQSYELSVTLGGSRVRVRVELPELAVTLEELIAAPREVTAFLPSWPVRPVISATGTLSLKQAALALTAGTAHATVDAKYDLDTNSAQTLAVHGADIDLQELVGADLPSGLAFDVTGALTDWRPETLGGALEATATWNAKVGPRLASAKFTVGAEKGVLKLGPAEVTSPGLELHAHGTATTQELDLFATVQASDLSQLGKTLKTFANVEVPGLGGKGTVRASMTGSPRGPGATVIANFKQFSIAGIQADMVFLNAEVPDVMQPLETDVLLHAQRLHFGERAFDDVTFDFLTHGRDLDVDLATRGLGDLRVHALGRLDKDSRGVELQRLDLTSAEAKWQLEEPTRMSWAEGFMLEPFALRDGTQRLSGEASLGKWKLDAKARVEGLDLAKLPRLLALPSLQLGGMLTADAVISGKTSKPEVVLDAQLSGGKVKGFEELEVSVKGSWLDDRAKGALEAQTHLGKVDGTFDLPVLAFLQEKPGEGTAHFNLKDVPLREIARQLEKELPVEGMISGVLDVSGSGEHPKVRVTLESGELLVSINENAEAPRMSVKETKLTVFTNESATLDATLHFAALGSASDFTLTTPLSLASLRKHPPTPEELMTLPLTLAVGVRGLDLHQLQVLGLVHEDELAGAVTLSAMIEGTVRAPTGEVSLTLDQVTYPPVRKASAKWGLTTQSGATQLTGSASVDQQQQAVELTASLSALPSRALEALLGPGGNTDAMVAALRDVPLDVLLTLKPFPLAQALPKGQGEAPPGGILNATLEVHGTMESPTARLLGAVKDLKFDRVALGNGRFDLKSTPTAQTFTIGLGAQGRDDFKAKGTLGLDLRLSSLRRGLEWKTAPVDLTLESRNFDLGFLSGATELLRVVAGRVDLDGRVTGELGLPKFVGDATVKQGRLALAGFGDYRDLALEVHAGNDLVEVKQLKASSGAGHLDLVARAVRQPSGAFLLTSSGSSEKFPVVIDDQLQLTASLKYTLDGDLTATLVDIHKLSLPRIDIDLPEVKRKDLQDLERPSDIIVLRSGMQRKKKKAKDKADALAAGHGEARPLVIRALLDAPRNIWVRSSDVNMEVGLSEGFRVELNQGLRLFGEARVIRGGVKVIGREFVVHRDSQARFAGRPDQPYVSVSALHVNAREQVKITVTVQGKGTDLKIKASSEPPMPESDIYAVLATGRRNLKTSGGATLSPGQAASVVGQLAASQLKTVIAKKLPIDVFNFDTSDNFEKVKLDVGKYLSDVVYLGGSVDIGAKRERGENVWAGRLELQITKSISLEAYAGDALSFGADAMWSRDF